jgi:ASC-1-like (ASCH) protein
MFMLLHEELILIHLEDDTLEELKKSSDVRKIIFNKLTVGVNVRDMSAYQDVAAWLMTVPEEKLKKITIDDVLTGVGSYIDATGYLV